MHQTLTLADTGYSDDAQSHSIYVRYFVALFILPILLYCLPFVVVRMPSYAKWNRVPDFPALDFGFNTADQNADVVIYGDSSANHGIDPRQMSRALGVNVLNIPSNLDLLVSDDDLPLSRYLRKSTPPRLIILYFAPWNLDYGHDDVNVEPHYNGIEMLLRYGTKAQILSFIKAHPAIVAEFPFMFYSANLNKTMLKARDQREGRQVVATNGHTDFIGIPHVDSNCVIPSSLIDNIRFDWVRKVAEKYSNPQTKVLVYVAPVPSCLNAQTVIDRTRSVLPTATPQILPTAYFLDDKYYIHINPNGVPQSTQELIDAVRPILAPSSR